MTGSRLQWYNGMALLLVFFSCRLVWGTYSSIRVYIDMFRAVRQTLTTSHSSILDGVDISANIFQARDGAICVNEVCARANAEVAKFARYNVTGVPLWLALTYVASNIVLNGLNYFWFSKMIETVTKRFREPAPTKKETGSANIVLDAASALKDEHPPDAGGDAPTEAVATAVYGESDDSLRQRKV
jgi:hypothetical protein